MRRAAMNTEPLETLRWQFQLTWRLAGLHLEALTDDACLWEPASGSWTVRRGVDGQWRADLVLPEPDPPPPVTIAWITWQMVWWWSGLQAALRGQTPPNHDEVVWPGSAGAARQRLEALADQWEAVLSGLGEADLYRPLAFPWPDPRPLPLAIAWANSELMKNVAELGVLRHLHEASRRD